MKKSRRKLSHKFKVNGCIVECTTMQGLADTIHKSKDSVMRYEKLGVFQEAPILLGNVRYYPFTLCERLKPLVAKFKPNKPPEAELQVEINKIFSEERSKLCR